LVRIDVNRLRSFLFSLLTVFLLASCASRVSLGPDTPLKLASFSENGVFVRIALVIDSIGQPWLAATYTPQQVGFHLYSNSLPRNGLNGEGRPTLLELPIDSTIKAVGDLIESADAEVSFMGPGTLLVYPAGPVTLSLPIALPKGKSWMQEQISITYEACSDMSCLTPVIGKLVSIRIPAADLVKSQ
jgi:hypothetical protein